MIRPITSAASTGALVESQEQYSLCIHGKVNIGPVTAFPIAEFDTLARE
jgi:hypothetical protein